MMVVNQPSLNSLAPNDSVIAIFCVAMALLVAIGARRLKDNPYFKYFAVSSSLFFASTTASILKSLAPKPLEVLEDTTLLLSIFSIVLATLKFRRVEH